MVDVFVSYKREERERCEDIVRRLRALELDVWFDARLTSGMSFDREIEQALEQASVVLVLWSPKAVDSEWVRNEATFGKEKGKLAAVQIAPCDLPVAFSSTHYEVLHNSDFLDDDPAWLKLVERIGALVGRPQLASFSKALAVAHQEFLVWARNNPNDPLAAKALTMVRELGQRPVETAARKRSDFLWRRVLLITTMITAVAGVVMGWLGWRIELGEPRDLQDQLDIAFRAIGALTNQGIYYDANLKNISYEWLEPARFFGATAVSFGVLWLLTARMAPGLYRVYR